MFGRSTWDRDRATRVVFGRCLVTFTENGALIVSEVCSIRKDIVRSIEVMLIE